MALVGHEAPNITMSWMGLWVCLQVVHLKHGAGDLVEHKQKSTGASQSSLVYNIANIIQCSSSL